MLDAQLNALGLVQDLLHAYVMWARVCVEKMLHAASKESRNFFSGMAICLLTDIL
jgi:hypothetical protein